MVTEEKQRQERRRGNDVLEEKIQDQTDTLNALVSMLTLHMTGEEKQIDEIKKTLESFFRDLDAHTHLYHHSVVAENIQDDQKSNAFWGKVKEGVTEKLIIFIMGAVMSYLGAVLWMDFADRVNKTEPTKPAIVQQVPIPQPPVVKPEVPNHP